MEGIRHDLSLPPPLIPIRQANTPPKHPNQPLQQRPVFQVVTVLVVEECLEEIGMDEGDLGAVEQIPNADVVAL